MDQDIGMVMKQQFRMKLECQVYHQLKPAPRNYTHHLDHCGEKMDPLKLLTVLRKQALVLVILGIVIHKVTKNLNFSSMHESTVNTDDKVITCNKQSTEVLLPEQ